jgi:hypothetical protein
MQIELHPEAGSAAGKALLEALAKADLGGHRAGAAYLGSWRRAALAEGVDRDPGYVPAPRMSRGATRA